MLKFGTGGVIVGDLGVDSGDVTVPSGIISFGTVEVSGG